MQVAINYFLRYLCTYLCVLIFLFYVYSVYIHIPYAVRTHFLYSSSNSKLSNKQNNRYSQSCIRNQRTCAHELCRNFQIATSCTHGLYRSRWSCGQILRGINWNIHIAHTRRNASLSTPSGGNLKKCHRLLMRWRFQIVAFGNISDTFIIIVFHDG